MAEHRIWFDCDTGVDDAIALLTAHRQPGLEIVGLSQAGIRNHEGKR